MLRRNCNFFEVSLRLLLIKTLIPEGILGLEVLS